MAKALFTLLLKVYEKIASKSAENGISRQKSFPSPKILPQAESDLIVDLFNTARYAELESRLRVLVEQYPDSGFVWKVLGVALKTQGKDKEAFPALRKATELLPDDARAHLNLGIALKGLGQLDDAVARFRRALEIDPDLVEAHGELGNALRDLEEYDEAVLSFRLALELKPDFVEIHIDLGNVLRDLGQLDNAVLSYRRALELKPDFAVAHGNLGVALKELGQRDSAVASYRRALEINPDFAMVHLNMGVLLHDALRLADAEASYRHALELAPDIADARWSLSLLLLTQGRYAEAWPHYESRYDPNKLDVSIILKLPGLPYPQWKGESLAGKSIAIFPEQGFGDCIQFARYVPLLKNRGVSSLTVVCPPPLKALLETIEGVDAVITDLASLPSHDYWSFCLSLPLHFGTTLDTIPASLPYLHALPARVEQWRDRLPGDEIKVGLVWKGHFRHKNDANRSIPMLAALAPLWSVPGVTFISLQKGEGEDEASHPPAAQPIIHLGSDIEDFADTAAIVAQLDLVICVDTAIAHVAGAMGKPCWVLLPAVGTDWRWLLDRTDSPWYPGVLRVFRQLNPDDWSETINEVAAALKSL